MPRRASAPFFYGLVVLGVRLCAAVEWPVSSFFQLLLRDRNIELVEAWHQHFKGIKDVEITQGDIFEAVADAVISPANSFGFMDGGIDLIYTGRFGWELQDRLREQIRREHAGELPVGQALVVETYDEQIPYLVSAPTMRVPSDVSASVNAYLAFRAALRAIRDHNRVNPGTIKSVLCPGLCTAIGRMPADRSARQMAAAYAVCVLGQENFPLTLGQAVEEPQRLIR